MKTFTRRNSSRARHGTQTGNAPPSAAYYDSVDSEELLVESPASQVKVARKSTPSTSSPAVRPLPAVHKTATTSATKRAASQEGGPSGSSKKPRSSSVLGLASLQPGSPVADQVEAPGVTDPFAFPPSSPESSPLKARRLSDKQVLLPTARPNRPKVQVLNTACNPSKQPSDCGPAASADLGVVAKEHLVQKEPHLPSAQALLPTAVSASRQSLIGRRHVRDGDTLKAAIPNAPASQRSESCPAEVPTAAAACTPGTTASQKVMRQQKSKSGTGGVCAGPTLAPSTQNPSQASEDVPVADRSSQQFEPPKQHHRKARKDTSNQELSGLQAGAPRSAFADAAIGRVNAADGPANQQLCVQAAAETALFSCQATQLPSSLAAPLCTAPASTQVVRSSLLRLLPGAEPSSRGRPGRPAAGSKSLPLETRQGPHKGVQAERGRVRFVEDPNFQSSSQQQQQQHMTAGRADPGRAGAGVAPAALASSSIHADCASLPPRQTETASVVPDITRNAAAGSRHALLPHLLSKERVARLGWAGSAPTWGMEGTEPSRLTPSQQSVAEAQEAGEDVALQDEASYALDGLRPTATVSTQRESLTSLVEMLATRRGRAALRSEGLAQQVLSCTSQLPLVSSDAVLSMAAAVLLTCMAAPDAHASYLTTPAAMQLASQLLRSPSLTCNFKQPTIVAASAPLPGIGPEHSHDPGSVASLDSAGAACLRRVLKLVKEGPLARQLQGLLGCTSVQLGSTQLVCIALAAATAADPSRIHCMEAAKASLRQEGLLQLLAQHVVCNCKAIWTCLATYAPAQAIQKTHSNTAAACAPQHEGDSSAPDPNALQKIHELLLSLRLMLQVLENATFTCPENEQHLLACTVQLPADAMQEDASLQQASAKPASVSVVEAMMHGIALLAQLFMCCSLLPLPAALLSQGQQQQQQQQTSENDVQQVKKQQREDKLVQHSKPSPYETCGLDAPQRHSWALLDVHVCEHWRMQDASAAEQLSHACCQALQAGLGLLVNLTHNHEAARQQMAAAKGLQNILQLVSWCAAARAAQPPVDVHIKSPPLSQTQASGLSSPASQSAEATQQLQPAGNSVDAAEVPAVVYNGVYGPAMRADKVQILAHSELLNVCLGLLINCSARCPVLRQQLRQVQVHCASVSAEDAQEHALASTAGSQVAASAAVQQQACEGLLLCQAVPMLCALLHAVMDDDESGASGKETCRSTRARPTDGSQATRRESTSHHPAAGAAAQDKTQHVPDQLIASQGQAQRQGSVTKTFVRAVRTTSRTASMQPGDKDTELPAAAGDLTYSETQGDMAAAVVGGSCDTQVPQASTPMDADNPAGTLPLSASRAACGAAQAAPAGDSAQLAGSDADRTLGGRAAGACAQEDVTEEELQGQQEEAQASIVQAYASLLLGILIQDCEESRRAAQALVPGHSLPLVVGCIVKTHAFYERTGAITDSSRQVMVQLLQVLVPHVMPDTAAPTAAVMHQ